MACGRALSREQFIHAAGDWFGEKRGDTFVAAQSNGSAHEVLD